MIINEIPNYSEFKFRLRPFNGVTQKEILYNEIYFSSISELNDPYDTRLTHIFTADSKKYYRLLECCVGKIFDAQIIEKLANYLSKNEKTYEELVDTIKSDEFIDIMVGNRTNGIEKILCNEYIIPQLLNYIYSYIDRFAYVCSFTSNCINPIIWSHYADQHKGFALIYFDIENKIFQDPLKRDVKLVNADGTIQFQNEPKAFKFIPIDYSNIVSTMDGFLCFNEYIYGEKVNDNIRKQYLDNWINSAKSKYNEWSYESEIRLIEYDSGFTSMINENGKNTKTSIERLFYYDPTQLIGIVFGSKMSNENKMTLKRIIEKKRRDTLTYSQILPFFYFIEAQINSRNYELALKVESIMDFSNNPINICNYLNEYKSYKRLIEIMKKTVSEQVKLYRVWNS